MAPGSGRLQDEHSPHAASVEVGLVGGQMAMNLGHSRSTSSAVAGGAM